jgi:hypothetical protein
MESSFREKLDQHNVTLAARRQNIAAGLQGLIEGDRLEMETDAMKDDFWGSVDIPKMSRIELKVALEARGLSTAGNKKMLRKRLELSVQDEKEEELEYLAMVEAARRAEAALEEAGSVYTVGSNRKYRFPHLSSCCNIGIFVEGPVCARVFVCLFVCLFVCVFVCVFMRVLPSGMRVHTSPCLSNLCVFMCV